MGGWVGGWVVKLEELPDLLHAHIPRRQQATARLAPGFVVRHPVPRPGPGHHLHLDELGGRGSREDLEGGRVGGWVGRYYHMHSSLIEMERG